MAFAQRSLSSRAVVLAVAMLSLGTGLEAQMRYAGRLMDSHSVTLVYRKLGSCTIVNRVRPSQQTFTFEPGTFEIFPPGAFSCEPHRFRDGRAEVNHPDVPVLVELSDPTTAPTVVTLSDPSDVTAGIALAGRAEFRSGGDDHAVRIGVEVGLDPATRLARDQLTCSRQDAFVSDDEASRMIVADASCGVSVMDVVEGSVQMADMEGVMTVTEFDAEVESEFYIVMDHGSANDGSSIQKGASLTYTVKSRYKFQLVNDTIDISSSAPPPEEPLAPEEVEDRFQASINYSLQTAEMGQVVLKLFGRSGSTLGELITPLFEDVSMGSGTVDFEVTPFVVPMEGEVVLVAELVGPDGKVLETTPELVWVVGAVELTIDHIEVVQVVQNASNTVPLIVNKPTVVRVFTKSLKETGATNVTVQLIGKRGNQMIGSRRLTGLSVPNPLREIQRHSHNFNIPLSWTQSGALELTAEVNPDNNPPETDTDDNEQSITVNFQQSRELRVRWVNICFEGEGSRRICPGGGPPDPASFLRRLYPVSDGLVTMGPVAIPDWVFPFSSLGGGTQLLHNLQRAYWTLVGGNRFGQNGFDQLIGWVPDAIEHSAGGMASDLFSIESRAAWVIDYRKHAEFTSYNVAHEIGHNQGLDHTGFRQGCGAVSLGAFADWPFSTSNTHEHGFDPRSMSLKVGTPAGAAGVHYDMMSYCQPPWISEHYYRTLVGRFQQAALHPAQAVPQRVGLFSGSVNKDGKAATLDPLWEFETTFPPSENEPAGEYCLALRGDAGELGRDCFDLKFGIGEDGIELPLADFTRVIPLPEGLARVALLHNGAELAALDRSANPPAIEITAPVAGTIWDAAVPQTIMWTATDTDGDPLRYALSYSPDGGDTWLPLALETADTQHTFNAGHIQGGSDIRFRVLALDGFHQSQAEVGPVEIVQRPAIGADDPVDLGVVAAGLTAERTFALRNPGSGPLQVTSITVDNPLFEIAGPTLPLLIRAGEELEVSVQFRSEEVGRQETDVVVESNSVDSPSFSFRLTAEADDGQTPRLEVDLAALEFGAVPVGDIRPQAVQLWNSSAVDVNGALSVSGEDFALGQSASQFDLAGGERLLVRLAFQPQRQGPFSGELRIESNSSIEATKVLELSGSAFPSPGTGGSTGPSIAAGGIVDAAQFQPLLARGAIGSIFGSNLADATSIAGETPLPTELGGTSVDVDGIPAPLFFASASQVNFQMPFEVPLSGEVQVRVTRNGEPSPPVPATVADYAPAIFLNPNTGEPIIQRHPDGALINAANPAQPGDVLIIFMTGIGDVSSPPPTGTPTPDSPLPMANLTPNVTVGGNPAQVFFAGLAPFFVGLGQVNIQLSEDLAQAAALHSGSAQGAALPLVIAFGENESQPVNLPIAGAVATPGQIDVSPAGLDFGNVNLGESADASLTIRNVGGGALSVTSIAAESPFAVVSPSVPFTVSPGGEQAVTLRFEPAAAGQLTGSVSIESDDPANPSLVIPLTGNGVSASTPSLSVDPPGLNFGDVNVGQSADQSLTLSNTGGAELTITAISSNDPQFSAVFAASAEPPFALGASEQRAITVRFEPSSPATHNATLSITSNAVAPVNVPLTGEGVGGGNPGITVSPTMVTYGSVSVGRTNELTLTVTNSGAGPLTVQSITSSDPQFSAPSPSTPFVVAPGEQQTVKVHFTPSSVGSHSGVLTFNSDDPLQPAVEIPVSGNGVEGAHIKFSDSFDRADANCSQAPADNAFGGGGRHGYVPLFNLRGRPVGAALVSGALQNNGMNYGGVQFTRDDQPCFGGEGEDVGQDVNIRVDLLVPSDAQGRITQAGPYFRTRSVSPGQSIIGGMSAGYWVQLHSTGQIKVKLLNPEATVAATRTPADFDNTVMHTVEISVQRDRLWVALDGRLQVFDQDDTRVSGVAIPAVWDRPPPVGVNEGAAGIAFGAEDNPEEIGGQRADNLVVTEFESLTELPVDE